MTTSFCIYGLRGKEIVEYDDYLPLDFHNVTNNALLCFFLQVQANLECSNTPE